MRFGQGKMALEATIHSPCTCPPTSRSCTRRARPRRRPGKGRKRKTGRKTGSTDAATPCRACWSRLRLVRPTAPFQPADNAPVLDPKPLELWPERDELPQILGHRAAHVMATRGCAGRCGYCAPASLQTQEWREGIRDGVGSEVLRAAATGAIAFTLLAAPSGCTDKPRSSHPDGGDAVTDTREEAGEPRPGSGCTSAIQDEQIRQIQTAAAAASPCFSGSVQVMAGQAVARADYPYPGPYIARPCEVSIDGGIPRDDGWASQVENAVAGLDRSCLCSSQGPLNLCPGIIVSGGAGTQIEQISNALASCGGPTDPYQTFSITVDGDGHVVGTTGVEADVSDCLVRALQGLVFPCLAGGDVCGVEQILVE
jgi:hypothetical protein